MHDVLLCSVVPTTDYNKVDIHSVVLHSRLPPILRTPQLPILHSFFLRLSQFKHFLTTSNASQINWVLALVAAGHKVRLHQTHWECWALPAAQVTWMRAESTCWRRTHPPPPPPPSSRSTFYVNDPSKARPTPTWLHSATLIRESVLAGISVTGTYLSEVPQSFLRIGYVLETRGPGWGVRPSPGCWRQERRGEDGDFPPHSAGWEPGPGAHTPQEGHQRRLQALSRSPVHLLPDPPHPRRARGPGWQHAWGEVCLSCCGACWINLWTPSCHVFPALLALLHCLQDVCLKSHQTSEKMISSIFLKCITIWKTVLLDHFRKQKLLLYNQFSFGEGEIQTQIWIQIQIIIFTISTR